MILNVTEEGVRRLRQQLLSSSDQVAIVRLKVSRPVHGHRQQATIVPTPVDKIGQAVAQVTRNKVTLYVDFADEWFFSGKSITVDASDGKLQYLLPNGQTLADESKQQADATTAASRHFEELWD